MGTYVFDNGWERERERLAGLECTFDPGTMRHMDGLGVSSGWECLELGGGGGSIAEWLCKRVGKNGRVVATDLDTRFLDAIAAPNLEVLRHDVVADGLPEASFDLIHARLLLEHLPPRERVLEKLIAALKPGGWILIEDLDWRGMLAHPPVLVAYPASDTSRSARVWRGVVALMCRAGYDHVFGARLIPLFVSMGLEEVAAEGRNAMYQGGTPSSGATRFTLEQLRDRLIEDKLVRESDIDKQIAISHDPERRMLGPSMIATWGRNPATNGRAKGAGLMPAATRPNHERLKDLALFAGCAQDELKRVTNLAQEESVEAGTALTREGETGDRFYVVVEGAATVTRGREKLATLGPGSFFGETALLTGGQRTATVTADTALTLASFDQQAFDALLSESRTIARGIMEGVAERAPVGTAQLYP
jgi:SAM-dependent methyltransferase